MPTYVFSCPRGHQFELFRNIRDFVREAPCECGETGRLVVQRTIGYVQGECRYDSPIDGRPITSWAQRKDDLARAGDGVEQGLAEPARGAGPPQARGGGLEPVGRGWAAAQPAWREGFGAEVEDFGAGNRVDHGHHQRPRSAGARR
jgi:hypothetical protein